jgi:hypothetical protein
MFFKLIVVGQILTKFGNFRQFWGDSPTMALVNIIPSFEGKKENVKTFAKSIRILHVMACWKAL